MRHSIISYRVPLTILFLSWLGGGCNFFYTYRNIPVDDSLHSSSDGNNGSSTDGAVEKKDGLPVDIDSAPVVDAVKDAPLPVVDAKIDAVIDAAKIIDALIVIIDANKHQDKGVKDIGLKDVGLKDIGTTCNGLIVDTQTDFYNCGTCGNVCGVNANVCTAGVCKCGSSAACSNRPCLNGMCLGTEGQVVGGVAGGANGSPCSSGTGSVVNIGESHGLAISPDDKYLYLGTYSQSCGIARIDLQSSTFSLNYLTYSTGSLRGVGITPDNLGIYAAQNDNNVYYWGINGSTTVNSWNLLNRTLAGVTVNSLNTALVADISGKIWQFNPNWSTGRCFVGASGCEVTASIDDARAVSFYKDITLVAANGAEKIIKIEKIGTSYSTSDLVAGPSTKGVRGMGIREFGTTPYVYYSQYTSIYNINKIRLDGLSTYSIFIQNDTSGSTNCYTTSITDYKARMGQPEGVAVTKNGLVFVLDSGLKCVRWFYDDSTP